MTRNLLSVFVLSALFVAGLGLYVHSENHRRSDPGTVALEVARVAPVAAAKTYDRHKAMRWAKTQKGKRYCSPGGNSGTKTRSCYDCSGLVGTAYRKASSKYNWLSGGTHNFLANRSSKRLVKTSSPRWGDLAFFGSGHVEFFVQWNNKSRTSVMTFGAHNSRTPIGYANSNMRGSWHPTAFYRVEGADWR